MQSICVFCGSSFGGSPAYGQAACDLGTAIARRGLRLVYGGSRVGLMGLVADAAMAEGGEVVGVIPRALVEREVAHRSLADLRIVETMHARKALMADLSDAFVALPGGVGTLEEWIEALTWAQLGLHTKPCALLDTNGYYAPFVAFLQHSEAEGFLSPGFEKLILVEYEPETLLDRVSSFVAPMFDKARSALLATENRA